MSLIWRIAVVVVLVWLKWKVVCALTGKAWCVCDNPVGTELLQLQQQMSAFYRMQGFQISLAMTSVSVNRNFIELIRRRVMVTIKIKFTRINNKSFSPQFSPFLITWMIPNNVFITPVSYLISGAVYFILETEAFLEEIGYKSIALQCSDHMSVCNDRQNSLRHWKYSPGSGAPCTFRNSDKHVVGPRHQLRLKISTDTNNSDSYYQFHMWHNHFKEAMKYQTFNLHLNKVQTSKTQVYYTKSHWCNKTSSRRFAHINWHKKNCGPTLHVQTKRIIVIIMYLHLWS